MERRFSLLFGIIGVFFSYTNKWIISRLTKKPLKVRGIQLVMTKAAKRAGITRTATVHTLRHSCMNIK